MTSLNGAGGVDILNGGANDDKYVLGADTTDKITDTAGTADLITSTITRSLAGYSTSEQLQLLGAAAINGTGNGLPNTLYGNNAKNVLRGGGNNDGILGQGGADELYGDAGNDVFFYALTSDSPLGPGHDIIRDFDDFGDDQIQILYGGGAARAATWTQSGSHVLVRITTAGTVTTEILLTNTTTAQVDNSDFFFVP